MADYAPPDQRRRMGNALMASQYDRATPEEGNVAQRHGLLPLATYDNGRTGLAFPGFVADPVQSFNRLMRNGYTPGDTQGVEDAFNVAGAAMLGGFAAPKPRNVVGSAGGELKGAALGAIPDTPGIRAYHGSPHDFDRFGDAVNWFSTSEKTAMDFGKNAMGLDGPRSSYYDPSQWREAKPQMYEANIKGDRVQTVNPLQDATRIADEINVPVPKNWDEAAAILNWSEAQKQYIDEAKTAGYGAVRFKDVGDSPNGAVSDHVAVFDNSLIEILRKYGLLGMAGGAAAAEYGGNSLMPSRPASPQYRPGDA